jgi:hypothetical protein
MARGDLYERLLRQEKEPVHKEEFEQTKRSATACKQHHELNRGGVALFDTFMHSMWNLQTFDLNPKLPSEVHLKMLKARGALVCGFASPSLLRMS